jgi:hypothetical protein
VKLPDLSFFINLGDWPLEKRRVTEKPLPLISWCGSDDSLDIVLPTYDFTQATLEMMDRFVGKWEPCNTIQSLYFHAKIQAYYS